MFGQVSQQHGQVEADFLSRVVEALGELHVVDLAVVVRVAAHEEEVDLLAGGERGKSCGFTDVPWICTSILCSSVMGMLFHTILMCRGYVLLYFAYLSSVCCSIV